MRLAIDLQFFGHKSTVAFVNLEGEQALNFRRLAVNLNNCITGRHHHLHRNAGIFSLAGLLFRCIVEGK